ncbi:MAG: glycosyltransferase family 2 protein [Calothrix sp. MO_167.B12]|nr:glycosyltransferase family 2 protein [Calothrix sp. MO_167.B12]
MNNSISIVENAPNFTGNIRSRLRDRTLLLRYLVIINLIFGAWYLQWRITNSINYQALWLSIPLLLAEIYAYVGGVMFLIGLWRPIVRQVRSLHQMVPQFPGSDLPNIDVFITCYNEPVEMVKETARAALKMDYPANKLFVYILDDGNSPDMRAMSERLCLEDLQSATMQQEAERIDTERSQLVMRLEELKNLLPEVSQADQFLQSYQLQVTSNVSELTSVLSWFDKLNHDLIPNDIWLALKTVLAEGFDNARDHAHKELPPETPIDIEVVIFSQSMQINICDRGPGWHWEKHLINMPDEINEDAERGRGIFIMQQVADSINYKTLPDNRNCLSITKYYQPVLGTVNKENYNFHSVTGYLHSLSKLLLFSHPQESKISDYISKEYKLLEQSIYEKELELSELSRCRYIARPKPKGKAHHAKAGNINYAIFSGETSGDLILTLDADHIPKPQFLQRVVPYFYDYNLYNGKYESNKIAFVQTPQAFYNLPPGDPFGHQAHLFYGPIQQAKDGMNAAFYTGTNAVLRREALISVGLQNFSDEYAQQEERLYEFDLVGGVSSNSITEDMNTAMRLHNAGWKSAYHHEELSVGLAPDDLSSTLKQRLRWAQGTIQVLLRENPFNKTGLTFWQQLQYFQTMYSYFSGFFTLIFITCPIIYFFTGIAPISTYGAVFVIHFLPGFIINRLTFIAGSWGIPAQELWRSEQYAISLFPLFIQSVWSVFTGGSIKFQVTPKQRQSGVYLGLVLPQLTVFILTILGWIWSIYRFMRGELDTPSTYFVNALWSIYNLSLLWAIIYAAVWKPKAVK